MEESKYNFSKVIPQTVVNSENKELGYFEKIQPLPFYFKNQDPQYIMDSFPGIDLIRKYSALRKKGTLKLEILKELTKNMLELRSHYMRCMMMDFLPPYLLPFKEEIDSLSEELKARSTSGFYPNLIETSENETVNGYRLYNCVGMFSEEAFMELFWVWMQVPDMTDDEFTEWYNNDVCTDWAKMDRNGESFGGFWKYPEGSKEKENAWNLTHQDNLKGLLELPYPRRLIKLTVKHGCSNRHECVRYSNQICVWFERKMHQMYDKKVEKIQRLRK